MARSQMEVHATYEGNGYDFSAPVLKNHHRISPNYITKIDSGELQHTFEKQERLSVQSELEEWLRLQQLCTSQQVALVACLRLYPHIRL